MRLYQSLGILASLIVAGCQYSGGGGYPHTDFSAAASPTSVVAISNQYARATHASAPEMYGGRILGPDPGEQVRDVFLHPLCGTGIQDGMVVAHNVPAARFFYTGWDGAIVCVSSAPDTAPFAVDREADFNVINEFGISVPDQPSLVVSDDKIAFTIDDAVTATTTTVVISLGDFLAGVQPPAHTPIHHDTTVRLTPVEIGYDIFWLNPAGGNQISIGRIRGVPGRTDAVRTRVATVPFSTTTGETAGVSSDNVLYIASHTGNQWIETALVLGQQYDDSLPYVPTIQGQARVPSGPMTSLTGGKWFPLSVSASPHGHMAVGWVTDDAVPHVLLWSYNRGLRVQDMTQNVSSFVPRERRDFVPMGVLAEDPSTGQYWVGVGFGDGTDFWQYVGGQHLAGFRDDMFP